MVRVSGPSVTFWGPDARVVGQALAEMAKSRAGTLGPGWERWFAEAVAACEACSGAGTAEHPVPEPVAECGGDDDLLSVARVAEVLGVSEGLVRRWCRDGRLPGATKPSGTWVVPSVEVASMAAFRDLEVA